MELESFQKQVGELSESWQEPKIAWLMMLLSEELGELVQAIRKSKGKRWGHEDEEVGSAEDISKELGDMLFLMARVAIFRTLIWMHRQLLCSRNLSCGRNGQGR
jgi:NTP pyrophosphatase (non-canonical NTP hydrolase)